jgi:hypothetical protein
VIVVVVRDIPSRQAFIMIYLPTQRLKSKAMQTRKKDKNWTKKTNMSF